KPAHEGSSIGVAIVDSYNQLEEQFSSLSTQHMDLFVENYIPGRELTVSLLDQDCYPILELLPKNRFYDYEAKYTQGMTDFILPAPLESHTQKYIQEVAQAAYRVVGCRGAVRVDMILSSSGEPHILELNTVPGMTDTSDLPAQALARGITFPKLVQRIIDASLTH
ncbi:MAG: ATP-grasp domain-containing protein, partial [Candidatus Margulisiibacteriota bacterium]